MGRPRWLLALLWAAAVVARGAETPAACALHALHDCQDPPGIVVPCGITRTYAAGPRCSSRLRLGGNKLRSFPQGARGRAVNRLSALSDASQLNPRIKVLDLSGSGLVNVTKGLRKLSALESLDVRGNKLASLQFLPEPCGLRKLEASWNKVSTLLGPLHQCVYLVKLNLGYNQIMLLPSGVFRGMRRLKLLVLTGNKISALPRHVFASLGKLRDLRLDKNELLNLPDGLFAGLRSLRNLTVQ
ncbi:Protein artichoke, partial [Gryllus bimaculatus]